MTTVNRVYALWTILLLALAVYLVINTIYAHQTSSHGPLSLVISLGIIALVVCLGEFFRGIFNKAEAQETQNFATALEHLMCSPRPQFTTANLVSDHELLRSIECAMIDLAARKIVFSKYELRTGYGDRLSQMAHSDLGRLLDAGKAFGVVHSGQTFTPFFHQAEVRVAYFSHEFDRMLAELKSGERPPLFW